MNMRVPLVLLLTILAAAGGFVIGRIAPPAAALDARSSVRVAGDSSAPHGSGGESGRAVSRRDSRSVESHGSLERAVEEAFSHTLLSRKMEQWVRILSRFKTQDGPELHALLKAEQAAGRDVKVEMASFWETWCTLDPAGAWAYTQASGTPADVEAVLKVYAMVDAAGAEQVYRQLGGSPLMATALEGILHGLTESDPALVAPFVSQLPEENQEGAAVHVTGSLINLLGNGGAQTWFDEQLGRVHPRFHKETARVLLESLSRADPLLVEKFALERFDQPWAANRDEQHFVAMMIQRKGGSPWHYISTAVEKLPQAADPLSLPMYSAQRQPDGALAWINANPEHPSTAVVAGGTAKALMNLGRQTEAAALIATIKNPDVLRWLDAP